MDANADVFDYHQVTDLFAVAAAHRFTGALTFHCHDGQPQKVEIHWKLTFGEQLRRVIRILRGKPPPMQ